MTVENIISIIIKSPQKNVADPAGVKPATSWSPVGRASNWATEASYTLSVLRHQTYHTTLAGFLETDCPGLDTDCLGLDTDCPGLDTDCPGLDTDCPGLDTDCLGLDTDCPGLDTDCLGLDTDCPGLDIDCLVLDTAVQTAVAAIFADTQIPEYCLDTVLPRNEKKIKYIKCPKTSSTLFHTFLA